MRRFFTCVILLAFYLCEVKAQNSSIKNLVFEGAGIRGIAYSGAIQELESNGLIGNIEKVGGTSAGAITAMMLSIGYSSDEIASIISTTKFNKFNDGQFFFIGGLLRMKHVFGWYRGESFTWWLEALIYAKTGNADITFRELKDKGFKELYITGTCLNRQNLTVFSAETYPNMKIKDAVRISMSIPLYFKAVFIDSAGKTYKRPVKNQKLDIMVDGGIIGNFPIFIFDKTVEDSLGNHKRIANAETLGIRIDSDDQIQSDNLNKELVPLDIQNFRDYISAFYVLVLENLNRNQLIKADWDRTISISSVGISPRIKRLSNEQKNRLIKSGRDHTAAFLKNHNFPIQ